MSDAQVPSATSTNPVAAAIQELRRRISAGEDAGSVLVDFDALPPREPDPEWDEWEQAVLARAFEE